MNTATTETPPKLKRIRRWAKRPANPNDEFPNASLSVMDVKIIICELEKYAGRIAQFKDRDSRTRQRRVQKLIEKLRQVKWSS